jgi:glycosyltransferase involved in cell wall biosynthesis
MTPPFDVVFYAPWASSLLNPDASVEFAAGGAETQLLLVARALARRGLAVGMIAAGTAAELPQAVDGVQILPQAPRPRTGGALRGRASFARHAWRAIRDTPAAVVVQRNAGSATPLVALAARASGARFVYSSANVVDFDLGRLEPPHVVRLFAWAVRSAAEVVVQTAEQRELCRERFGRDPWLIRSVAEPATPRTGRPDAFLWIGRIAPYKRLGLYLDLAAAVPEARFEAVVVRGIADPPELVVRLERAGTELPNLVVHEHRPRPELGALMDRSVAVVNTSEYEGMPNVFLEAWSRGVPALAFSHDPDGLVAEHGLGAFASGSRDRLVALTRELWRSRADQRDVAARCIEYVRAHHDPDVVAAKWADLLQVITPASASRHASQTVSTS